MDPPVSVSGVMKLKSQVTKFCLVLLLFQFEFINNIENLYDFTQKALNSISVLTKQRNKIVVSNLNILISDKIQKSS